MHVCCDSVRGCYGVPVPPLLPQATGPPSQRTCGEAPTTSPPTPLRACPSQECRSARTDGLGLRTEWQCWTRGCTAEGNSLVCILVCVLCPCVVSCRVCMCACVSAQVTIVMWCVEMLYCCCCPAGYVGCHGDLSVVRPALCVGTEGGVVCRVKSCS